MNRRSVKLGGNHKTLENHLALEKAGCGLQRSLSFWKHIRHYRKSIWGFHPIVGIRMPRRRR